MVFRWLKNRRRKRILAAPFPPEWTQVLERRFAQWRRLGDDERARLAGITQVLVAEKDWVGCGGLEMSDAVKVTVAAQAGLLILNLPHDYYRNVDTVLVYPTGYKLPRQAPGLPGGTTTSDPVLGHAQYGGPVVLSWRSTVQGGRNPSDGRNLVFHEFAHKLDMLDGVVDGTPPLRNRAQGRAWVKVMTDEYDRLRRRRRRGLIRDYGATNVAEFFAVVTEVFFEKPRRMHKRHPALYGVLADFYSQDPIRYGWNRGSG